MENIGFLPPSAPNLVFKCKTYPKHLPCTIVKPGCVPDARPPPKEGWPNKPRDLNVTVFMKKHGSYAAPGLNITWRIPDDISYKSIKGFQLTLSVMSGSYVGRHICRTFNLSGAQWEPSDLREKVMFYYDGVYPCIRDTTFLVSLYSLPKSDAGHTPNNAFGYVVTPGMQSYDRPNPARWVTPMSFTFDTASNRVDVWFNLAPSDYRFVNYEIMLINATSQESNQWTQKTEVVVREGETGVRHVVFLKVCNGTYKIYVQPKNTGKYTQNCVCKDERGTCQEFCYASTSAVFNVMSKLPCRVATTTIMTTKTTRSPTTTQRTTTTRRTTTTKTTSAHALNTGSSRRAVTTTEEHRSPGIVSMANREGTTAGSEGLKDDKMAAIIVGVVLAIILLAIVSILFVHRRGYSGRNCESFPPWKKPQTIPPITVTYDLANNSKKGEPTLDLSNPALEGVEISRKRRVLLVYANDHPLHLAVVHHLAQFLNTNCACEVSFDQWSVDEIRRHSYVTWLWQEIGRAERIIIVNSLGAFRQYEAFQRNASYINVADDSPPQDDDFLVAMATIKNSFGRALGCSYEKLLMVYFPYTSETHVLRDINPGHRYKLMKHIEDVVLHIHGLQRFNPDSVQSMGGGLNYAHYHQLTWGEPLAESINKMAAYVSSQPNWFDKRFTLVRSDSGFSSDGVETENQSESPREASGLDSTTLMISQWCHLSLGGIGRAGISAWPWGRSIRNMSSM
ncbi:hypothetical protein NP493_95g07002 [Ridgeia piscesae]|uniref:SEFIR domain-containing protein n=1 Tax=Ridgeia piscesae TaxID=27915 RepID=A0AAD9P8C5_RIDPI|nr:hypothetical protein NP493_95g07002 [Ridgeia piscesae]